jgi:glycosyltransferase involved in cell wall biosynthesis
MPQSPPGGRSSQGGRPIAYQDEFGSRTLILIPAWNEAQRVGAVIRAIGASPPVLVVDDGSTDDTAKVSRAAGVTLLRHDRNLGKGEALLTGFAWALERGFEAVITMDADGQHDPADLPQFLEAFAAGEGDLIIGLRDWSLMPFPRRYTNPLGSWLLSKALGVPVIDSQSGFRLYSSRLLRQVELRTRGFELETEVIIQAAIRGLPIGWVPIGTLYGIGERSYYHPIRDAARFMGMLVYALRQRRRAE